MPYFKAIAAFDAPGLWQVTGNANLMQALDKLNQRYGQGTVKGQRKAG